MSWVTHLRSSIGEKTLMAVTGVFLLLFVFVHMLGNLQIFLGPEYLNAYAAQLQSLGPLLWLARIFLLLTMIVHIWAAARVVHRSRNARPVKYVMQRDMATNFAAKTMLVSGLLILVFVVYHILNFTTGDIDPSNAYSQYMKEDTKDVYNMVVGNFRDGITTLIYSASMLLLCLHISHGASSLVQTLGISQIPEKVREKIGPLLALLILIGNLSIPLCVYFGVIANQE